MPNVEPIVEPAPAPRAAAIPRWVDVLYIGLAVYCFIGTVWMLAGFGGPQVIHYVALLSDAPVRRHSGGHRAPHRARPGAPRLDAARRGARAVLRRCHDRGELLVAGVRSVPRAGGHLLLPVLPGTDRGSAAADTRRAGARAVDPAVARRHDLRGGIRGVLLVPGHRTGRRARAARIPQGGAEPRLP